MKLIVEQLSEDLPSEDVAAHFSALGECSVSRVAERVTVSYPDFCTALKTLLSLHFSPLLKSQKLAFQIECSVDVAMEQQSEASAEKSEGESPCKLKASLEEIDWSSFRIVKKSANDEFTQVRCLCCLRTIQKRSVLSHLTSVTHKRNLSSQST